MTDVVVCRRCGFRRACGEHARAHFPPRPLAGSCAICGHGPASASTSRSTLIILLRFSLISRSHRGDDDASVRSSASCGREDLTQPRRVDPRSRTWAPPIRRSRLGVWGAFVSERENNVAGGEGFWSAPNCGPAVARRTTFGGVWNCRPVLEYPESGCCRGFVILPARHRGLW